MAKAINPHIRIHVDFFIRKLKLGLIYIKVHGIKLIFSFGFSKHVLTREPAGLRPYSPRHTESSVSSHKKAEKATRCCFFQHPVAITISFLRHTFPCASILLLGFEHLFTLSTQRTHPIFGQIFEGRSGSHPVIGIAHLFLFTEHTARFSTEQDDLRTINGTNRDSPLSRTSNQYRHTPV